MLMLPATKTRPIRKSRSDPNLEFVPDLCDVDKGRQSRFVAEALDLVGRGRACEIEMVAPAFAGMGEIGIDVGAVEDVAGAIGVDHALARDQQRRHGVNSAGLVVPE